MCEVKWSQAFHVFPLYCPYVRLQVRGHVGNDVRRRVENESHTNDRRNIA